MGIICYSRPCILSQDIALFRPNRSQNNQTHPRRHWPNAFLHWVLREGNDGRRREPSNRINSLHR